MTKNLKIGALIPARLDSERLPGKHLKTSAGKPMTRHLFEDEESYQRMAEMVPLGRPGEVEDLMGAMLYLASDASAMVTGHILAVDGGWLAR